MSVDDYKKAHESADTDFEAASIHHSLGRGPNNAAPGNHNHNGVYAVIDHVHTTTDEVGTVVMTLATTPPPGYLFLNGQSITRANYPVLFDKMGIPVGTDLTYLPDVRDVFPVGANGNLGNAIAESLTKVTAQVESATPTTPVAALTDITNFKPGRVAFNFMVKAA